MQVLQDDEGEFCNTSDLQAWHYKPSTDDSRRAREAAKIDHLQKTLL